MERIKRNKWALVLFISTIAILVMYVVGIITTFAGLESVKETVREAARQIEGATQDSIDLAVKLSEVVLIVGLVFEGIFTLFVVLCGLKCSMKGAWRLGAIIFGILITASQFFGFFGKPTVAMTVTNVIALIFSVGYLVGACLSNKE